MDRQTVYTHAQAGVCRRCGSLDLLEVVTAYTSGAYADLVDPTSAVLCRSCDQPQS